METLLAAEGRPASVHGLRGGGALGRTEGVLREETERVQGKLYNVYCI